MWWSASASTDYYSIIAGAVSKLPTNTVEARRELYSHARATLARQLEQDPARIKRERRALEKAIRQVESRAAVNVKQLNRTGYEPASTALLIASIFFLNKLWALDCTSMSAYWVARLPRAKTWVGHVVANQRRLRRKRSNPFSDPDDQFTRAARTYLGQHPD
jgi:hypothetical protein